MKTDKYGFTPKQKEELVTLAMKGYHLTREQAEAWYNDEEALNL